MLRMTALGHAYLQGDDPLVRSGFSGGRDRWVFERSPLVAAIHQDGTFLDVGCANGLLAEDVANWAAGRGFTIFPFGIDLGKRLIAQARNRHSAIADHFEAADAWRWTPTNKWTFVYSLLDLSPAQLWCEWVGRLHRWVEPGGRLIIGSYGM